MTHYFIPCYQENMKTSLLTGEERNRVLNNISKWSINTKILNDGEFYQLND